MCTIAHIEKYLLDNKVRISLKKAVDILKRTREAALQDDTIPGSSIDGIFCDTQLADEFKQALLNDASYVHLGRPKALCDES